MVTPGSQGFRAPPSATPSLPFPLSDVAQTHLPNRPGMEVRGLLHAHSSIGGQLVSIYTTHLQHASGSMRIEQAHAIRQLVDLDPITASSWCALRCARPTPADSPAHRRSPLW